MHSTNCANDDISVPLPETTQNTKKWYLYGRLIIANIPALTGGMMMSWSSPVLPKLNTLGEQNPLDHVISTTETAIIASALSFGAIISPYLAAYLSEKIGRRHTLLSLAVTFIAGLLILAFARHVYLYYVGRLLIGFAYGSVYTVLPVYLVEFAGNTNRGAIVNTSFISAMIGSLLSLSIGPFTSIMGLCLISAAFPITFIVLFITLMPETPHDLIRNGKEEKARESFLKMNLGNKNDFELIKRSITAEIKAPYSAIFKVKSNLKAMGISFMLTTFKQLSGVTILVLYTQNIFEAAGGDLPPEIPPIIIECIMVLTALMVPYFVENHGRKFLLKLSSAGTAVFFFISGGYFYLEVSDVSWLPIISVIGCKLFFALGLGTIPWILMAELLPYNVKAAGAALINSSCWGFMFIVNFAFPIMTDNFGMAVSFWIFGGMNFLAFIYSVIVVPETRGKNAQEIQDMLNR